MSPVDSAEPEPVRVHFTAELDELRLQTEMMGVLVDRNLERVRHVLQSGDLAVAAEALAADDDIDATNVSLTEQCYEVLRRESPVAADLRLVVSVIRVTGAFERVGDLCLRIAKLAPEHELIASNPASFEILLAMADIAVDHFREGLRAWSAADEAVAEEVALGVPAMDLDMEKLTETLIGLSGPDAARLAIRSLVVGHSLQRISDHSSVLGRRIQYLLTGDQGYLAAEVR